MRRWEYRIASEGYHHGPSTEESLRYCGDDGWELVSATHEYGKTRFYFKRKSPVVSWQRLRSWWRNRIGYICWQKNWKGVYINFLPMYCVSIYLWGADCNRKWRRR